MNENDKIENQEQEVDKSTASKNEPTETRRKLKFQSPVKFVYVPKKQKPKKDKEEKTEEEPPVEKKSGWKKAKNFLEMAIVLSGVGLAAWGKYQMDKANQTTDDSDQEGTEFGVEAEPMPADPEITEVTEE